MSCSSLVFRLRDGGSLSSVQTHVSVLGLRHRTALVFCTSAFQESAGIDDVLVVGGGIAGASTGLAMHKLGLKVRVLEQSPSLRISGAALGVWTNGWRALEFLEVADNLREKFTPLSGHVELRGVDRRMLLESLTNALPADILLYDSHVVKVHRKRGCYPQAELKDGSLLQAKVIVGCDGIGSVVAKNLGLKEAHYAGYMGIRGVAMFPEGYTLKSVLSQSIGNGVRMGRFPLDSSRVYWFLVFNHPPDKVRDPSLVKEEALRLIQGWPEQLVEIVKRSPVESLSRAAISDRWMWPWSLWKLHQCGVTVAGDAMHPVTPNLAQGGCTAMEDAVLLARILSNAFNKLKERRLSVNEEMEQIDHALGGYVAQRQKRMLGIAVKANLIGKVFQTEGDFFASVRNALLPRVIRADAFVTSTLYDVRGLV
ncbi:hypothetical protein KP509_28G065900 [Ceratopteris richardii]|uniref:FAD-binding domain-containing protein n=1 Tax=Ceratopteris richardii TaxID=49495 RepID=A0A8T2REB4_CERRI|nr:hypothetical protein KP509_28G065900 [Ceratopteris richardii]